MRRTHQTLTLETTMTARKTVVNKTTPVVPVEEVVNEQRVLYTIRISPSVITKLKDKALKLGTTHAAVAREILQKGI